MAKPPTRLVGIDALRGIAALMVVVYHARAQVWVGMGAFLHNHHHWSWNPDVWIGWLFTPFRLGFLGVQLLFVLSGYCIHRNQAKALAAGLPARLDLGWYAFRRFFRIYPTYVAALAVNGIILYALLPWLASHHFPATVEGHHSWYVFGMNLLTMQNILVPPYEGVFWSLSIEIHLYIAYPLLLAVSRKYGPNRMLLLSFLGTLAYLTASLFFGGDTRSGHALLFFHALFYWFTWCCGAYVAELQFGRAKGFPAARWLWPFLLVLGAAFYLVGTEDFGQRFIAAIHTRLPRLNFDGTQILGAGEISLAIAVATLLVASLRPSANRVWNTSAGRLSAFVGLFSYSLYAIHVPVLFVFAALIGGKTESMTVALLGCACAVLVAYVFFNIVERWTLNPPKRLSAPSRSVPPLPVAIIAEPAVEPIPAES